MFGSGTAELGLIGNVLAAALKAILKGKRLGKGSTSLGLGSTRLSSGYEIIRRSQQ
jgi:hypothetical protein